jgi:hypothetical protein
MFTIIHNKNTANLVARTHNPEHDWGGSCVMFYFLLDRS